MLLAWPGPVSAAEGLHWKSSQRIDAEIYDWPLQKLLGQLAASTGWKVYVEPGLEDPVSAAFSSLPQGEALRLLLGNFNYALLPGQGGGPSKLYVFKSSMAGATSLIAPELASKPANWLANEIIVTLPPGSRTDIEQLAEDLGGKVVSKAENLNSYRLEFEDAEAAEKARRRLAAREDLRISDNYQFRRPDLPAGGGAGFGSFGIDPAPVGQGDQITVAVVDTPVQPLDGKMKDFLLPGIQIAGEPGPLPETPTHGTSMVQTLLNSMARSGEESAAGKVRVLPVDIYGGAEMTTTFEVARGLQAAIQQNPSVINLSLGGTGYSPLVEQLLEIAYEKQIVVFASAGNTPTTAPTYPAASPYVLGVTAAGRDGSIAPYANRGAFVDIKAPGKAFVRYNGQTYISTGTSTATAFASGQAAALAAEGMPPAEVAQTLLNAYNVSMPALGARGRP